MIVITIIAIPMTFVLQLSHSNLQQSAQCREIALARQLLMVMSELFFYAPIKELRKHQLTAIDEQDTYNSLQQIVDLAPFLPGQVVDYYQKVHGSFMKS